MPVKENVKYSNSWKNKFAMFNKGLLHGLLIVTYWMVLSYLNDRFNLSHEPLGALLGLGVFIPLLMVGYIYKARAGMSPLTSFLAGRRDIMFYPLGISVWTTALITTTVDAGLLYKFVIFPFGMIFQALSLSTCIWGGSWFKKSQL